MSLRKKVTLSWKGVNYPLLVTMEVIDRVDDEVNIGRLLVRELDNDARQSHQAKFLALMLNEAGADVVRR